jgi:hypothetical protein
MLGFAAKLVVAELEAGPDPHVTATEELGTARLAAAELPELTARGGAVGLEAALTVGGALAVADTCAPLLGAVGGLEAGLAEAAEAGLGGLAKAGPDGDTLAEAGMPAAAAWLKLVTSAVGASEADGTVPHPSRAAWAAIAATMSVRSR